MPSAGAIITVAVAVAAILLEIYLRYLAPSETVIAKIINKRSQGLAGRRTFFVTLGTQHTETECVIQKANWDRARPGEFAKVTVAWKDGFVQRFEPLRLKPEAKIRLEKMLENGCVVGHQTPPKLHGDGNDG